MGATATRTLRAQGGERAGRWVGERAHVVDRGQSFFSRKARESPTALACFCASTYSCQGQ